MTSNPWNNKQLRSMYDPVLQCYWFSVVDLCAVLTDCDHKTARGYWKRLKYCRTNNQLVTESHQLKFESSDGKHYFREVLDFKNLVNLILTCPSPKANTYRLWLVNTLFAGVGAIELEKELATLGAEQAKIIEEKHKKTSMPYVRLHVVREEVI